MKEIIQLENIIKIYPPNVVAVDNVSVSFYEGEIHAIVGENGAGKSTLMKALCASEKHNAGEIKLHGNRVNLRDPGEAIAKGIGMLHQEILLIPEYSVWENIVLGIEPTGFLGRLNSEQARTSVENKIREFGFNINKDQQVADLSLAAKQKVEILKLLYRNINILILDEPTSVLTPQEIPQLFQELRNLRDQGHTIIFISHHLDEVMDLSDRITVLRKGKKIATVDKHNTNKKDLARMMVDRDLLFSPKQIIHEPGEAIFEMKDLSYHTKQQKETLNNINLKVYSNEIVGIAGVEGNGQFELVFCIMGLLQPSSGKIIVSKNLINNWSILQRRKLISFVPQDRGKMGASTSATITENAIMTHHRLNPDLTSFMGLVLNARQTHKFTENIRQNFSVVMDSVDNLFGSLSGGNQQKMILGRELSFQRDFILLDQPTRGLDIGSIEYVHDLILKMRQQNRAILLISSDLEELFMITDRILVMYRGEIVANLQTKGTSVSEVGSFMLEGKRQ